MAQALASAPAEVAEEHLTSAFILKIAERCNLNCGYCYMYNKGDSSFEGRPKFMSAEVARQALVRIAAYAQRHELDEISLALHGGEPMLAGRRWIAGFLQDGQRIAAEAGISFRFAMQTNGTLLDAEWLALFGAYEVRIGISCDGPAEWHDRMRPDLLGRGSYASVRRGLDLLKSSYGSNWGVLAVADPTFDGPTVLRHFAEIGVPSVDFLWPDHHHDDPPPWPAGALGRYFCDLFDLWYAGLAEPPHVRWFESAISLLTGGPSFIDSLGPHPITDVMLESDGTWEPLDVLRTCGNGITRTGLCASDHDPEAIWAMPLFQTGLHNQALLPEGCRACSFRHVCGGGYLPHRFKRETGFANASVHCADLLTTLEHIRSRIAEDLRRAGVAIAH